MTQPTDAQPGVRTCECGSTTHSGGRTLVLDGEPTHVYPARLLDEDSEWWDEP